MNDHSIVGRKHPLPADLPKNTEALLALRVSEKKRNLNDQVEDVYLSLYEDKAFQAFLYATYDEQAVEGSLSADNVEAARMIRNKAIANRNEELGRQKLATISKCLGVVLRRYEQSRKERRNTVGGELVLPGPTDTPRIEGNGD